MNTVTFHAFSFLQKKLKDRGKPYTDAKVDLAPDATARTLITMMGLKPEEVEAVFVNGTVSPLDKALKPGDRVAVVPPGTPGPYRVLLGMVGRNSDS